MPKHNTYEQDENISDNDIVLGSDAEDNLKTKNFRIGKLKEHFFSSIQGGGLQGPIGPAGPVGPQGPPGQSASVNYKTYRAIATQNDINDLEVNVLENTIGIVTVNQFSTGIFLIKLPEGTDLYKVFLPNNLIKGYVPGFCTLDVDYFDVYSNSDVMLRTYENINNGFVFTDFILNKTPIEIIVYN